MKIRLTLYILALSVVLFSCKDKSTFTISGNIVSPGVTKKVYLLTADSTTISVIDSTNINDDGNFQFKHPAPYANLYKIRLNGAVFDFIAKNGDAIEFKTSLADSTHAYGITGSDDSEKIKEFNKISNAYGEKVGKLANEYQMKSQQLGHESDSLLNTYRPKFELYLDSESNEVLNFVNANKTSLAAFYAVTALDPNKYEQQLIAYADDIKDNFKDNPVVAHFVNQMNTIRPVSIGHKAPDFTTVGLDDKPVKLSDYKGKYVLLDFWASWCAPCRQENPNLVKQYSIFKSKGLNILGVSLDTDKKLWEQAIKADKLTWAHASDLKNFDGPTEKLYRIEAIPSNFIIDPAGNIIAKNVRGADLEEFLNKTFTKPKQ